MDADYSRRRGDRYRNGDGVQPEAVRSLRDPDTDANSDGDSDGEPDGNGHGDSQPKRDGDRDRNSDSHGDTVRRQFGCDRRWRV